MGKDIVPNSNSSNSTNASSDMEAKFLINLNLLADEDKNKL